MKRTNYLDLITSIDVLNTVNGGVSEPQLNLIHYEDYREIRLKIPGISLEEIHVEVHNNNLSIFYFHFLRKSVPGAGLRKLSTAGSFQYHLLPR